MSFWNNSLFNFFFLNFWFSHPLLIFLFFFFFFFFTFWVRISSLLVSVHPHSVVGKSQPRRQFLAQHRPNFARHRFACSYPFFFIIFLLLFFLLFFFNFFFFWISFVFFWQECFQFFFYFYVIVFYTTRVRRVKKKKTWIALIEARMLWLAQITRPIFQSRNCCVGVE